MRESPFSRILAVDLGGVIEDTWETKRSWLSKRGVEFVVYPGGRREIAASIVNGSQVYDEMVSDIYAAREIKCHEVVEGAKDALDCLSKDYSLVIVTTRSPALRKPTSEWLQKKGFHSLIKRVVYLGARDDSNGEKARWCMKNRCIGLIDDDLRHLIHQGWGRCPCVRIHLKQGGHLRRLDKYVYEVPRWDEVANIFLQCNNDKGVEP